MNEALMGLMNKECVVTMFGGGAVIGVLTALNGNWLTVSSANEKYELINLDYVSSIEEFRSGFKNRKRAKS